MSLLPCPCGSTNIGGADREAAWCWDCGLTFDIQGYMPNGVPKSHQAWNDLSTKFSNLKSAFSPKAPDNLVEIAKKLIQRVDALEVENTYLRTNRAVPDTCIDILLETAGIVKEARASGLNIRLLGE